MFMRELEGVCELMKSYLKYKVDQKKKKRVTYYPDFQVILKTKLMQKYVPRH